MLLCVYLYEYVWSSIGKSTTIQHQQAVFFKKTVFSPRKILVAITYTSLILAELVNVAFEVTITIVYMCIDSFKNSFWYVDSSMASIDDTGGNRDDYRVCDEFRCAAKHIRHGLHSHWHICLESMNIN